MLAVDCLLPPDTPNMCLSFDQSVEERLAVFFGHQLPQPPLQNITVRAENKASGPGV